VMTLLAQRTDYEQTLSYVIKIKLDGKISRLDTYSLEAPGLILDMNASSSALTETLASSKTRVSFQFSMDFDAYQ